MTKGHCPECDGWGYVVGVCGECGAETRTTCPECHGSGRVEEE